jgi:hypothetical protein
VRAVATNNLRGVGYEHLDFPHRPVDLAGRLTNVWRKENSAWKIIYEHNSFPVDLATGKPDLQSKL